MRTDKRVNLKIGYKDYVMYFVKKIDGGSTYGDCHNGENGVKGVIRISKGMKKVEKLNTILHEILHAIVYTQGMDLEDKMEERVVLGMANGLVDFMRENPLVMRQIMDGVKKK